MSHVATESASSPPPPPLPTLRPRPAIGILTGSGPEAGLDLWAKLLQRNRARLGDGFRGDIDAPALRLVSEPALGLSMELERTEAPVWAALEAGARALGESVSVYAIACNTLNLFADRLHALALPARLLSFADVLQAHLATRHATPDGGVCLLGARPVAALGRWSPYAALARREGFEPLNGRSLHALHRLIYDIKTLGPAHPGLHERFAGLLRGVRARTVVLACTELPLIAHGPGTRDRLLLDPTLLVADALLDHIGVPRA